MTEKYIERTSKWWKPSECTKRYNKALLDQLLRGIFMAIITIVVPTGATIFLFPMGLWLVWASLREDLL